MRSLLMSAVFTLSALTSVSAKADAPVVVFVESSDSEVTSQLVRARMRESGVGAMGAADAPAGPIATLAIVYRGAGESTRFRLRTLDGRVVVRDSSAPSTNMLQWVARRACQLVHVSSARETREASAPARRATTEVLNPWEHESNSTQQTTSHSVVNPWDTPEEPRRRRRRRSVGRVAGASVARYSEVLDPWSQSGREHADIVDPWDTVEDGEGLARPERRRRRR